MKSRKKKTNKKTKKTKKKKKKKKNNEKTTKKKNKKQKKTLKITTIYEAVEQTHYCVEVFTDYHMKRALSLCIIYKKSTSKFTLCTKRIMLSL